MVGAGAVVTKSVPPFAIVVGNPARIVGYVDNLPPVASANPPQIALEAGITPLAVNGVILRRLNYVHDLRGDLTVGNFGFEIPFAPARYFFVLNVPSTEVRGEHAHHVCHQFLVAAKGRVSIMVDDGRKRQEVLLDSPDLGIYLPPLTWGVQYKYSAEAVLLVFASHVYDSNDYIRDYDEFLRVIREQNYPQ